MLYHEREGKNKENANFVHIIYLLAKLCIIFDEAFLLTSVYYLNIQTSSPLKPLGQSKPNFI